MKRTWYSLAPAMAYCLAPLSFIACSSTFFEQGAAESAASFQSIPADEDAVQPTPEERLRLLSRATTYGGESDRREERSILEGPKIYKVKQGKLVRLPERELAFGQPIACDYIAPWLTKKPGGKTKKFSCDYRYQTASGETRSKKLKVKYDDAQFYGVYGEAIASRLVWALGFPTDIVLPVQVRCKGCPTDPWVHVSGYWELLSQEEKLATLAPGSQRYASAEVAYVGSAVRYIASTLTRLAGLEGIEVTGKKYEYQISTPRDGVVFSTATGALSLGGQSISVYDPAERRLLSDTFDGVADYAINHIDPGALGFSLTANDFVSATVEVKHLSLPIETYYHEGWTFGESGNDPGRFAEIDHVDPARPSLALLRQELALLAVFIQHADNKAENQRMVCLDADKIEAESDDCEEAGDPRFPECAPGTNQTFDTCETPVLMLQDLGVTMGYGATDLSVAGLVKGSSKARSSARSC